MDRRRFLSAIPAFAALAHYPRFSFAGKEVPSVASGNTTFALDLFAKLAAKPGNLFCSPLSISAALAMTSRGAAGDTLGEMSKVLHLQADGDQMHADFAALVNSLTSNTDKGAPELMIANALWAHAGFHFKQDFLNVVTEQYRAGLKNVDFGKTEAARREINSWVEAQTKGKIKELFAPGVLTDLTRMVLTNAIYFKGAWRTIFQKQLTHDGPFHVAAGTDVQVPLMRQTSQFQYGESDTYQAVELPYRASSLGMLIVLPKARDGLASVESRMTVDSLTQLTRDMKQDTVLLTMPRFKSESAFSLGDTLAAMGMPKAFSRSSDFTRMSAEPELYIQAVVHKAVVEVNEEGTEAAAATGVAVGVRSAAPPRQPKTVRVDHPFLYFIRDSKTGAVLFMGRLTEPKAS